jgi:hypothetical protein
VTDAKKSRSYEACLYGVGIVSVLRCSFVDNCKSYSYAFRPCLNCSSYLPLPVSFIFF